MAEELANASLIAAAPRIKRALSIALNALAYGDGEYVDDFDGKARKSAFRIAQEAISEATGEPIDEDFKPRDIQETDFELCEQHPWKLYPHGTCIGGGMPLSNVEEVFKQREKLLEAGKAVLVPDRMDMKAQPLCPICGSVVGSHSLAICFNLEAAIRATGGAS